MERRIKLTFAAVALGLLAAGAARRWAKENDFLWFAPLPSSPSLEQADFPIAEHGADSINEPPAPRFKTDYGAVAPAAAHLPLANDNFAPDFEGGGPPRGAILPAPQPNPAPRPADGDFRTGEPRRTGAADPTSWPAAEAPRAGSSSSTSQPLSPPPPDRYVTQPNDSFWTISQRIYGTGRYFQALYEHNRRLCPQPDRLPPGVPMKTPAPHELERLYPELFR